jgi:hypothetical protein
MTPATGRGWRPLEAVFYGTRAGRFPARDFIEEPPSEVAATIYADIAAFAKHGERAPVSWKWITGKHPMRELRTGAHRILFVVVDGTMWILGACKKQDQRAAIERAVDRMKELGD